MSLEPRTLEEAIAFERHCTNCHAKFKEHTRHKSKSNFFWCPRIEGKIIEYDPESGRGVLLADGLGFKGWRLRFTMRRHWIRPGSLTLFAPCWRLERAYRLRRVCRGGGSS